MAAKANKVLLIGKKSFFKRILIKFAFEIVYFNIRFEYIQKVYFVF